MTVRSRSRRLKTWVLGAVAVAAVAAPSGARAGDEPAVRDANARFYSALNALFGGEAAPMAEVWSHRDDVTYMGPAGGVDVGWDAVRVVWEKQAALKLGGAVTPTQAHVTVGEDLAVVNAVEQGENTNIDGTAQRVSIRATNLFRNENGTWKMIGHHTDLLPRLESALQMGGAR